MSLKRKTHYPPTWDDPSLHWEWKEKPEASEQSEEVEETAEIEEAEKIEEVEEINDGFPDELTDDFWRISILMEEEAVPEEKPLNDKAIQCQREMEKDIISSDDGIHDSQKSEPDQKKIGKRTIKSLSDQKRSGRSEEGLKKGRLDPNKILIAGIVIMVMLVLIIVGAGIVERSSQETQPESAPTVAETPPAVEKSAFPEGTDPLTLGSLTQLVNKTHGVPETYEPSDLTKLELPSLWDNTMRAEAASALDSLFSAAEADGCYLICCSGFRNYTEQQGVYEEETALRGEVVAKFRTSLPGFSEHQTGLAMDVTCEAMEGTLETTFIKTPEGQWLAEHAHEYGFIIRYPDGMEKITGYTYEPWHIRYLGKAVAEAVYHSGKTYEEYLGILD